MRLSILRFLPISIVAIMLAACSLKTTKGLVSTDVTEKKIINPYFSSENTDYIYKAKIAVYGRYFGGILIIKKVGPVSHRVVFTTEFGSKIFDFLYEGDTFTKNFIIEDLDRGLVVNTLQKDFKILTSEHVNAVAKFTSESHDVYKSNNGKRFDFYFFGKSNQQLEKIINTSKTKEKVVFTFTTNQPNAADKIAIEHHNIKLAIDLDYFKKE